MNNDFLRNTPTSFLKTVILYFFLALLAPFQSSARSRRLSPSAHSSLLYAPVSHDSQTRFPAKYSILRNGDRDG